MASVYKVRAWKVTDRDESGIDNDEKTVSAKDAEQAIVKAKKSWLADKWDWEDDAGVKHHSRVTRVQIRSVEEVTSIDIA